MSEIWNFSPFLEDKVQLCISSARREEHNKWLKEFGHLKFNLTPTNILGCETAIDLCDSEDILQNDVQNVNEGPSNAISDDDHQVTSGINTINSEELIEGLETEFSSNIEVMVKECLLNHTLLSLLAARLSTSTIEKVCKHIYDEKGIDKQFLSEFFEFFLPVYVKREYNSATHDILVRGSKIYPLEFRILLKVLAKDTDVPSNVLQDYILTLNEQERSTFIMLMADFDLSGEEFVNNVFSIYTAYKDCMKSEKTQSYVHSMLSQYSTFCSSDRNYGRLFLTYLQAQKSMKGTTDYENLEKLLDVHRSPFKRPCLNLLKELMSYGDGNLASDDDDSK